MKPTIRSPESYAAEVARRTYVTSILISETFLLHAKAFQQTGVWLEGFVTFFSANAAAVAAASKVLTQQAEEASKPEPLHETIEEFRRIAEGSLRQDKPIAKEEEIGND